MHINSGWALGLSGWVGWADWAELSWGEHGWLADWLGLT